MQVSVINVNLNYTRIYNESETFILYNLLRGTTKSLEKVLDTGGSRAFTIRFQGYFFLKSGTTHLMAVLMKTDIAAMPKPDPETKRISTSSLFRLKY